MATFTDDELESVVHATRAKGATCKAIAASMEESYQTVYGRLQAAINRGTVIRRRHWRDVGTQGGNEWEWIYLHKDYQAEHAILADEDFAEDEDEDDDEPPELEDDEEEEPQPRAYPQLHTAQARNNAGRSKEANTYATAAAIRKLFQEIQQAKPDITVRFQIDELEKQAAQRTPAGGWMYIAGTRAQPLARSTLLNYLHGFISGDGGRKEVGPDLLPEQRTPKRSTARADGERVPLSITPLLDTLDRIRASQSRQATALRIMSKEEAGWARELEHNLRRLMAVWDLEWEPVGRVDKDYMDGVDDALDEE